MTTIPLLSNLRRLLQPRPLALLVAGLILAWSAWQWASVSLDRAVQSSDIATRQVELRQAQLNDLTLRLKNYARPEPPAAVSNVTFIPPVSGTATR